MKKSTVVIVATSEKTWKRLGGYCFNEVFLAHRKKFDLAVVFNGEDARADAMLATARPDAVLRRPNVGFDIGAFDHGIKNLPAYERYLLLHDDHWFADPQWFEKLNFLCDQRKEKTVFGNVIYVPLELNDFFEENLRDSGLAMPKYFSYIHGLSGFFSRAAVEAFLRWDGIPHAAPQDKEEAIEGEVMSGFLLGLHGFELLQMPPGYALFLIHNKPEYFGKICEGEDKPAIALNADFAKRACLKLRDFLVSKRDIKI